MQPLNFSTEMNEIRSGVAGRHETKLTMGLNYIRRCLAASRKVNGARARSGSSAFYFFFAGPVFTFGLGFGFAVALGLGAALGLAVAPLGLGFAAALGLVAAFGLGFALGFGVGLVAMVNSLL